MRCDLMRYDLMRCDLVRCDLVRCDVQAGEALFRLFFYITYKGDGDPCAGLAANEILRGIEIPR